MPLRSAVPLQPAAAFPLASARSPAQYITEGDFNWRMVKNIMLECHLYDKDKNYKPFDFKKEEPMFAFLRKVVPNSM